jgi:hypothetical protein
MPGAQIAVAVSAWLAVASSAVYKSDVINVHMVPHTCVTPLWHPCTTTAADDECG